MTLIGEKKRVFNDLRIPWDSSIEDEFTEEVRRNPEKDAQLILDRICKPYLEYAFEHEVETYYAWLKAKYGKSSISRKNLVAAIGVEGISLLMEANLIYKIPKEKRYIING